MVQPAKAPAPPFAHTEEYDPEVLVFDVMLAEVFVVDDDPSMVELLQQLLEGAGYWVRSFGDPLQALEAVGNRPPAVLVTDLQMPQMTGLDLGLAAQALDRHVKVVLLTGAGGESAAQEALRMGATDYLTKPPDPDELIAAVQRAVLRRASDLYHRRLVGWTREVTLSTLASLVNALDARSPHFRGHSQSVAMQAAAVAQALHCPLEEVESIRTAGLLHDIGMIGVPDAVVQKPETLTPTELDIVRSHCERGAEILEPMSHLGATIRYVREHHERLDGSGYPDGKKGDEISLGGQIVGISEAWTAILERRAHRPERSREEGMNILSDHEGTWFSEMVTDALRRSDVGVI